MKLLENMQLGTRENTDIDQDMREAFEGVQSLLINKYDWDRKIQGRFSANLILGLTDNVLNKKNIGRIIEEIYFLEGDEKYKSITKPASMFNQGLLCGLWHKHYHVADLKSLSFNLIEPLKNKRGERRFNENLKTTYNRAEKNNWNNFEKANYLVELLFEKQLENLEQQQKMTGEWIIYHNHNGKNYYLAIAEHLTGEYREIEYDNLGKQIQVFCSLEFPEFKNDLPIFI